MADNGLTTAGQSEKISDRCCVSSSTRANIIALTNQLGRMYGCYEISVMEI